jgi:hypothetical protein
MLAIDVLHIKIRIVNNTLTGDFQQFGTWSISQSIFGTGLNTAGGQPFGKARGAHGAFIDKGVPGIVIIIGWNIKRAGYHAITATNAQFRSVQNRSLGRFVQRLDETG